MSKNIILIGYMGCGKSSVGRQLAKNRQMDYIDLDDYIEMKEKDTIREIFKNKGEVYFRKIEATYLQECLGSLKNTVLSLGGGTPCFGNNMQTIVEAINSPSVYLQTSIGELAKRLFTEKDKRPLIAHTKTVDELTEFIAKHVFERSQYYLQSQLKVSTNSKSVEEIVTEIGSLIEV
ncbi:shikimate kinase [Aquimarina agarilytica]|uniref:shikimate kinase n=1 Tax=Aquimarina agarilytica TaxID=1087449 RepID=UPI0002E7C05A|nr:shikimate kinase [Aquimarina agarilytica]